MAGVRYQLPPKVLDLEQLANSPEVCAALPRLKGVVRKAGHTQSCLADLMQADAFLTNLRSLPGINSKFQTKGDDVVANALLIGAVIFYARATSTSGSKGERGSADIRSSLSSQELGDHSLIVTVRNTAIAHVYSDRKLDDLSWHSQRLCLIQDGAAFRPASASNMVTVNSKVARSLERQLPIAMKILHERFQKHIEKIASDLQNADLDISIYLKHEVDPVEFFGSEAMAKSVVKNPNQAQIRRISD